jgi:hypothetical protein
VITTERNHDGAWILTALVRDRNPLGNPWGDSFYETRTYYGYSKREAIANYPEDIAKDGLYIVKE